MHPKKHQHRHKKTHRGYTVSGRTGYGVLGFPWYALYMGGGGNMTGVTPGNEEQNEGGEQENDNDAGTTGNAGAGSADGGGAGAGSM